LKDKRPHLEARSITTAGAMDGMVETPPLISADQHDPLERVGQQSIVFSALTYAL